MKGTEKGIVHEKTNRHELNTEKTNEQTKTKQKITEKEKDETK